MSRLLAYRLSNALAAVVVSIAASTFASACGSGTKESDPSEDGSEPGDGGAGESPGGRASTGGDGGSRTGGGTNAGGSAGRTEAGGAESAGEGGEPGRGGGETGGGGEPSGGSDFGGAGASGGTGPGGAGAGGGSGAGMSGAGMSGAATGGSGFSGAGGIGPGVGGGRGGGGSGSGAGGSGGGGPTVTGNLVRNGDFSLGELYWHVELFAGSERHTVTNGVFCQTFPTYGSITIGWPLDAAFTFSLTKDVRYLFAYQVSCSPAAACEAAHVSFGTHIGTFTGGAYFSYPEDAPTSESLQTIQHVLAPTGNLSNLGIAFNVSTSLGGDFELCIDNVMVVPAP